MTNAAPSSSHELRAWVDVTAMVVAAAFGANAASSRRLPLAGVLLARVVVGIGGGMIRDVSLHLEPVAITTWYYIPAVLAAAIVAGLIGHQVSLKPLPFVATQAFAMGLLITIGVQKAVQYHAPAPGAILLGVITGSFGGASAEILSGIRPTIMREGPFLLGVVLCGSVIFYLLTIYVGFYLAVVVTVVFVVSVRVLSVRFDWSAPVLPEHDLHSVDS